MAVLVCDVCGGKLVMGSGGIATCDVCGIEYSTERLREMFQALREGAAVDVPAVAPAVESVPEPAPAIEATPETAPAVESAPETAPAVVATPEMTPAVESVPATTAGVESAPANAAPDTDTVIANYLSIAESALHGGNNEEAESYANRILELDSNDYRAWYIKGCAAGWQSTFKSLRLTECVSAFAKAAQNAPEDKKDEISQNAKEQFISICKAVIAACAQNFENWPDEANANAVKTLLDAIIAAASAMTSAANITIDAGEFHEPIATQIVNAAVNAFQRITFSEYSKTSNDPERRTTKLDWEKYLNRIDNSCSLLLLAESLYPETSNKRITLYKNLILMQRSAINSRSWKFTIVDNTKQWEKFWVLDDSAKKARFSLIATYEAAISNVKQARIDAFWQQHADEKAALEAEKSELEEQVAELREQASTAVISVGPEIDALLIYTKGLMHDMEELGLFKAKERKALQDQIDIANNRIQYLKDSSEAKRKEITQRIHPLEDRLNAIKSTLSKPR